MEDKLQILPDTTTNPKQKVWRIFSWDESWRYGFCWVTFLTMNHFLSITSPPEKHIYLKIWIWAWTQQACWRPETSSELFIVPWLYSLEWLPSLFLSYCFTPTAPSTQVALHSDCLLHLKGFSIPAVICYFKGMDPPPHFCRFKYVWLNINTNNLEVFSFIAFMVSFEFSHSWNWL